MKYLGAHIFGGLTNALDLAGKYGMSAIQVMPTAPIRWAAKEIPSEIVNDFAQSIKKSTVRKILLHGIYLVNLARGDKQLFHMSKISLVTYLNFAHDVSNLLSQEQNIPQDIDLLGVCFHPGAVKDLSEEDSKKRVIYGINWVLENSRGGKLLIETTAGAGNIIGDTFEELQQIYEGVEQKDRIGFVLDTQHLYASGYDWVNNLDNIVISIKSTLNTRNISAFHINDSMSECGSHKDRHADLGEGKIGETGIRAILNHPDFSCIPFIMETPSLKNKEGILQQYNKLKQLAAEK